MKNYIYIVKQKETNRMIICENLEKVIKVITNDYTETFLDELPVYEKFTEKELKDCFNVFSTKIQKISTSFSQKYKKYLIMITIF